jgi:hypothetical protein
MMIGHKNPDSPKERNTGIFTRGWMDLFQPHQMPISNDQGPIPIVLPPALGIRTTIKKWFSVPLKKTGCDKAE